MSEEKKESKQEDSAASSDKSDDKPEANPEKNASESKEATGTEGSESKAGDATGSKETAAKESESKADDKSSPAAAGEQGKSAAQSSGAADTNPLSKRRSLWKACVDSFVYVNNISQDEAVKVRDSDRATSIWLMIVSVVTVVAMLIEPLAPHRMPLLAVCDILIGMSIFYYIGNRFGIIGTFNPRQALLAWQLMMGAAFFGIFITINLALLLGLVVVVTAPSQIPNF